MNFRGGVTKAVAVMSMTNLRVGASFNPRRLPIRTSAFSQTVRGGADAQSVNNVMGSNRLQQRSYSSTSVPAVKARDSLEETSKSGEFIRTDSGWRDLISSEPDARFQPEAGRYHLFVAYACPWAHRTLMTRALKGLEDVISVTIVHPIWQPTKPGFDEHKGWIFGDANGESFPNAVGKGGPFPAQFDGNDPEPFFGSKTVRDLYEKANDTGGKYSVPILWDKKEATIVNNE